MFLPALTLTLAYLGEYALVMRSSLLETMREDYLVLARAKGLRDIARAQPPRGAQRAAAGGDADRDQLRLRALRRDRGGGDLLLARPRPGHLRRAQGPRPADAPGPVPRLQRRGDRLQPARRPALRATSIRGCAPHERGRRPLGAPDRLAAPPARGGGGVARVPPPHARGWSAWRSSSLAVAMALAAPLLADSAGLHAVNTTANPAWANPSKFGPLGTDHLGRSVLDAVHLGRAHQPARRAWPRPCSRWSSARSSGSPPASSAAGPRRSSCG